MSFIFSKIVLISSTSPRSWDYCYNRGMKHLSYLEISKENVLHNISLFQDFLPKGNELVAVVKGNAYGHGLKEVVSIAEEYVDAFQVDDMDELREIRKYTQKKVFIFGYVLQSDLEESLELGGILGVYNTEIVIALNKIGKKQNKKVVVHLKVDTLIGRQGILGSEVEQWIALLKDLPFVEVEAVYSHFSNIEDVDDLDHARLQHAELLKIKKLFMDAGFDSTHHISATSGLMTDKENWQGSLARLGVGMYGLWPSESLKQKLGNTIELKPVLSWKSHVAQVKMLPQNYPIGYGITYRTQKEQKVAVIPQGYSDGHDRRLSNIGEVLIRGKRCKVLGRVAMNMFVVNVDHVPDVELEDEVVLIGKQGSETITADEIAEKIGTINYEVVARLSPLLPRTIV